MERVTESRFQQRTEIAQGTSWKLFDPQAHRVANQTSNKWLSIMMLLPQPSLVPVPKLSGDTKITSYDTLPVIAYSLRRMDYGYEILGRYLYTTALSKAPGDYAVETPITRQFRELVYSVLMPRGLVWGGPGTIPTVTHKAFEKEGLEVLRLRFPERAFGTFFADKKKKRQAGPALVKLQKIVFINNKHKTEFVATIHFWFGEHKVTLKDISPFGGTEIEDPRTGGKMQIVFWEQLTSNVARVLKQKPYVLGYVSYERN